MRSLFLIAFAVWPSIGVAAAMPDMVCKESKGIHINPDSLGVQQSKGRTLYRFHAGSLYLSSPQKAEYLYNKVQEVEPMRYISGYKTLQFESPSFETAIFVHSYRDEVRVSRVTCKRQ
jgi:hypothetical protein